MKSPFADVPAVIRSLRLSSIASKKQDRELVFKPNSIQVSKKRA
jgi:hypothetical protein